MPAILKSPLVMSGNVRSVLASCLETPIKDHDVSNIYLGTEFITFARDTLKQPIRQGITKDNRIASSSS